MAEYLIPEYRVPELQKKVQRIANKGANVTFNILEQGIPVEYQDNARRTRYISCDRIEISGEYKINGWVFVATIEHAPDENIIRVANPALESRIPARYRYAGRECEHCHIRRDRNDTYLVYNEDEDEWKQVGKTCLQGYTNGLNAETCAALASVMREISKINDDIQHGGYYADDIPPSFYVEPMNRVRKKAFTYIRDNGYQPGITGMAFSKAIFSGDDIPEASEEDVDKVTEYLAQAEPSAYIDNARAAWNKPSFQARDGGLITSAVYSYFRNEQKLAQQRAKEQARQAELANINQTSAGEVGDKVTFTIEDFKVLYMRNGGSGYYASEYPVYRIVGTDGRIYIWGCSDGTTLEKGMQLRGTIKKISEYRGEMQTEVTRCRIVV